MKGFTDFFIGEKDEKIKETLKGMDFDRVIFAKKVVDKSDFDNLENCDAVLIDVDSMEKLRQFVDKAHARKKTIIVKAGDDSFNRAALETKKISILLSPEAGQKADFMSYRNSGLNQVLCKIAEKNNIAIGISFSELLEIKNDKELAERLGRIMQNIMLCRKYKTKIQLANFASKKESLRAALDIRSFGSAMGLQQ
jgi:RNase P/RNase MRP subunit p30